jgi:hypothetical protein
MTEYMCTRSSKFRIYVTFLVKYGVLNGNYDIGVLELLFCIGLDTGQG